MLISLMILTLVMIMIMFLNAAQSQTVSSLSRQVKLPIINQSQSHQCYMKMIQTNIADIQQ